MGTAGPLLLLGYFKYYNFVFLSLGNILNQDMPFLEIILPIGISFYTFQGLSYVFDIYRQNLHPCDSLTEYALFIAFFPQLVAGPIVRASEFLPQLKNKIIITPENLQMGTSLILWGLFIKVVIADNIAPLVTTIFNDPVGNEISSFTVYYGTILFGIQIFCDFSGYTDIAIGSALLMGFRLPQNFLRPYLAQNPSQFWRRWHMTLSRFIRDYVYIPFGGNRKGKIRTYLNLLFSMLVCGLWHGAAWNFVIWGGFHGILLAVHKLFFIDRKTGSGISFFQSYPGILTKILITQYFIFLGWLIFRVGDLNCLVYCIQKYLIFDFILTRNQVNVITIGFFVLIIAYLLLLNRNFSMKIEEFIARDWIRYFGTLPLKYWGIYVLILLSAIFWLAPSTTPQFIYFAF